MTSLRAQSTYLPQTVLFLFAPCVSENHIGIMFFSFSGITLKMDFSKL